MLNTTLEIHRMSKPSAPASQQRPDAPAANPTAVTHPRQKLRRLDPAIQRIYDHLAPGAMLVSLRPGQPRPTTLAESRSEDHELDLSETDVAVALGEASDGLYALGFADMVKLDMFIADNPALRAPRGTTGLYGAAVARGRPGAGVPDRWSPPVVVQWLRSDGACQEWLSGVPNRRRTAAPPRVNDTVSQVLVPL